MNPCLNKIIKVSVMNLFIKFGTKLYNVQAALEFHRVGSGAYFSHCAA